ncbi:MAG: ATP-binding protein [Deltaproteobacteria bacterium]|nr:ATP-binding protein [Deltaproteobacteria bacterium]
MKHPEGEKKIRLTIESRLENVSLLGISVEAYCRSMPLDDVEIYQIQLCVVEAVNNAIRHAYDSEPGHEVELIVSLRPQGITLRVCDEGRSIKDMGSSTLDFDAGDLDSLPEGGMGLFLIHSVMDEVSYETRDGRNILTMSKSFAGSGPVSK